MKLNVKNKTRNFMVGGFLSIVMIILVSLFIANFKTMDVKAYAQDANCNSANDDYVVTIINEHDGNTQTYNYDSFGDAWFEANNKSEFLNGKTTFTLNKDTYLYNFQIENSDSEFFKSYKDEYNNKCFGCKGNGDQYQGKGNNDHFLLAMPGAGVLTINLNGHKLCKADHVGIYVITPTLQVDHRNVNLLSYKDIKSEEDYGKIEAVSIFNDNQDISKTLSIKNIKFDAKIQNPDVEVCSGVRCKTQYGLEIDNCIFTNYCFSSPVEVGSSVDKWFDEYTYTNKTTIKNTKFVSNIADEAWGKKTHGGAIHADNFVANFNINNCVFNSNSVLEDGGAIMLWGADDNYKYEYQGYITQTNVTNCTFENNKAGKNGGAIWNNNVYFVVADCKFINNKAKKEGGAINIDKPWNWDSTSALCGLSFDTTDVSHYEYRQCDSDPYMKWRDMEIKNNETIFTGNEAGESGGAINIPKDRLPLFAGRMIFKDNRANSKGGAINLECGKTYKTYISLQPNTYLYARYNWVGDHQEDIRLDDAGFDQLGTACILITCEIDKNSEFAIWTNHCSHKVIRLRDNVRWENAWVGSHVPCNNDCGGDAWFENCEDYIKYWRD